MKGKKVIAGILLAGILAVTLAGCKNKDNTKEETEKPVITLGSDNYPPYNYLNEDGVPTGIDVELSFDVLPHHAPMIAALEEGVIRYQTDEKKEQEIKIQSGFVEIKDDILSVCIE